MTGAIERQAELIDELVGHLNTMQEELLALRELISSYHETLLKEIEEAASYER